MPWPPQLVLSPLSLLLSVEAAHRSDSVRCPRAPLCWNVSGGVPGAPGWAEAPAEQGRAHPPALHVGVVPASAWRGARRPQVSAWVLFASGFVMVWAGCSLSAHAGGAGGWRCAGWGPSGNRCSCLRGCGWASHVSRSGVGAAGQPQGAEQGRGERRPWGQGVGTGRGAGAWGAEVALCCSWR